MSQVTSPRKAFQTRERAMAMARVKACLVGVGWGSACSCILENQEAMEEQSRAKEDGLWVDDFTEEERAGGEGRRRGCVESFRSSCGLWRLL